MDKITVVEKIGGSCLLSRESYREVAAFLAKKAKDNQRSVVVISAQKGHTGALIIEAAQCFPQDVWRQAEHVVSGEFISALTLIHDLEELGVKVGHANAADIGLSAIGDDPFNCDLISIDHDKLLKLAEEYEVLVIPGYAAVHQAQKHVKGTKYVALGRGATDYIAVALASILECACNFRKNSGFISSVDPRIVPSARKLNYLTYGQARQFVEYSSPSEQFLMLKCLDLASYYNVPLRFLAIQEAGFGDSGTSIGTAHKMVKGKEFVMETFRVLAIQDVCIFQARMPCSAMPGLYNDLLGDNIIFSDFIERKNSVAIAFLGSCLDAISERLRLFGEWTGEKYMSVTLIDSSINPEGDHITRARSALNKVNIEPSFALSLGAAIRIIVSPDDLISTVNALAQEFDMLA